MSAERYQLKMRVLLGTIGVLVVGCGPRGPGSPHDHLDPTGDTATNSQQTQGDPAGTSEETAEDEGENQDPSGSGEASKGETHATDTESTETHDDDPDVDETDESDDHDAKMAVVTTATSTSNDCFGTRPFYWELGDVGGSLASGSVDAEGVDVHYEADTVVGIASASKWIYGAYVAERQGGHLDAADIQHLTMRSGYSEWQRCPLAISVAECATYEKNAQQRAEDVGYFYYAAGNFQQHAVHMGLGAFYRSGLGDEMTNVLGGNFEISYNLVELGGGAAASAETYAQFLRLILADELEISGLLGSSAVCTNPERCPDRAHSSPIPVHETWHYSIGHWVEDDPEVGDGSFSSLGAFGFYPWIDAARRFYGIIAKHELQSAQQAQRCGRLIRRAWQTGVPQ